MEITNLHEFLQSYFKAHHCGVEDVKDGALTVQLSEEMDRTLMNRPFYWHYVKATGNKGVPMKLTLVTNQNKTDVKGERIHFGSPRLHQILNHLKEKEQFTRLFQKVDATQNTALFPWLITNIKVSYEGKQKKDEIFSIGLHLVNGMMKSDMMNILQNINLNMTISNYCYTISPIIKLKSGFKRIETIIDDYINNQSHQWANEAIDTLEEEVQLVHHFYNNAQEEEYLEKEINEITNRYKPRITYKVINGGIVYLKDDFLVKK
ncbi:YqhG family protein [Virgibacillus alimentarius]|uniref:ASC-1-like (ASCH) protein n=1 Tax=Virgibacillus alimentarius TaxID=698769 RepID=A0ABS4S4S6_9BACI|nr:MULTISPECIES: YqhG family protein [Virgibacillus]MBP2256496.1 ASC-1-like (ASCH) protein [Virgibacillus alimentarius]HLR66441.1 YqhG family protein [Virgibacillus sp.]